MIHVEAGNTTADLWHAAERRRLSYLRAEKIKLNEFASKTDRSPGLHIAGLLTHHQHTFQELFK